MKTNPTILASTIAALLLASVTGCQSSTPTAAHAPAVGPATGAVLLSSTQTYDRIGRTGRSITYSKPEGPESDVISQGIRAKLDSLGYQYQPGTPDFVVSIAWGTYHKVEQPLVGDTQTGPQTAVNVSIDIATLSLAVRDTATGSVLWQGRETDPVDPHTVSADLARALTAKALTDFPPSATTTATARN